MFHHSPERPSPRSTAVPPPPSAFASFLPPLSHWAVARCLPFRSRQGTSIFQWGHCGWSSFPPSKTTTVSRTCRWKNCTRIAVLVAARPGHPSTGQFRGPPTVRKSIVYIRGSSPGDMAAQLRILYAALPFCVCMCPAINPSAISSSHSLHCTCPLCLFRYQCPSPVIHLPYAAFDCVPAAWNRQQTMPTVFLTLVISPTLSNRPTKVLKYP